MRDRAASPSVDYAALFDAVPEPMLVLDAAGRIRAVNGAWRRFAKDNGADEATALGVGLDYLSVCRDYPGGEAVAQGLAAVLEGRQPYFEHAYRCNSPNELRRCLLRAAVVPGSSPGQPGGAFLAHLDVTGRELAEERLHVQRRVASSLAAGRPVLDVCTELAELVCERLEWDHWELWGLDAVGRPRLIKVPDPSPQWLADFLAATRGVTLEPGQGLPGRVWSRRQAEWVGSFEDKSMPRGAAALRCGLRSAFAIPLVAGDETLMALTFYSRLGRSEDRATTELVMAIGAQIAELARRLRAEELARGAELELEQGRAHLYSMLEHAPGHVVEVDGEGRIRYMNRSFTVPREQALGMRWTFSAPVSDRARLDALFGEVMQSGVPRDFQLELLDAGGKPRSFHGRIGPLWRAEAGEAKTVVGAVIVTQDVTEVRRLQAELDTTQRLASVGTLAAGVAHEINNPLSSIIANLSLAVGEVAELLNTGVQAPELLSELEDARAGAERIRGVARDLKLLARPKDEPTGPVEVVPLIESMLRLANNEIRHRAQVVRD
ncbi:MAG: PAS domain-containing protein, partial [Deltaproteobacteria bacterium]|nr:PAS domain-containing protein [Deltaproteobacteria bacterium]